MSATPNKRLHEEAAASGGSSGTSGGVGAENSKYPNDDSAVVHPLVGPKLGPSVALSDYHHHHHTQPFDHAGQQDSQIPVKIRSPLLPMYHNRVSPSSNVSHFDHPVAASENRSESRDNARDLKAENRDARDSYQSGKEKESKEAKHDRDRDDNHPEYKDDSVKTEKEGYGPGNSHLSWKESKEHHRGGKRYPDIPGGNVDPLHASRANLQGPFEREAGKEFSTTEERDYYEAHEAVGENKFDFKGEDKFKERDRKRKDLKHRDWLDKDKNERRNNLHLGSSSGDGKEPVTEEREAERWERERKDLSRDKEKPKEREKDHVKREAWNGAEKDGLQNDKEPVDAYARTSELENSTLEQKKQRDHDGWKNNDGEARERRKGRDADVDEERPEKRSRWYDKDSDDGCADTDLGAEKEREVFSYGVQQRKRMLRPRGSPQVANREPRFRSRTQDNEG